MKNVTLSVDEDVLVRVRRYAVERRSSVNALVREYLKTLAEKEDRAQGARRRLRELSRSSRAKLGARSWARADLHER
jgi:hypothetical protein